MSEDSFQEIIDPETGCKVPVESKIGELVIKNYIECLMNGPDSDRIVSTKMLYKPKTTNQLNNGSVRGVCNLCRKNVYTTQERVKEDGKYFHEECYSNNQ